MLKTISLCSFFALSLTFSGQSISTENTGIKKINDHLYVMFGGNGNGAHAGIVLNQDSILLIDTMKAKSVDALSKNIKQISPLPISELLITHNHFDHIGGIQYFSEKGAKVIAAKESKFSADYNGYNFFEKSTIRTSSETIETYWVNSHSASDAIYYLKNSNTVFLGDIYTSGWYPSFFSGGLAGQLKGIQLALSLGDDKTIYVPGHGDIANKDSLQAYAENCSAWVSRIMQLHAEGLVPSEIIRDEALRKIRERFATKKTDRERFDKFFSTLVENTVKVQSKLMAQS